MSWSPPPPPPPMLLDRNTQLLTAPPPPPEPESQLSALIYDMSQQAQMAMSNMLKMIVEIEENGGEIMEEIGKCKDSAVERKRVLNEEKDAFQKAAYAVLDMLNN